MQKAKEIQNNLETKTKSWFNNLDAKKKSTVLFIPRVLVFMFFCTYFSGFIYNSKDLFVSIFAIIIMAIIVLFLPLNKILEKEK